MIIVLADVKTFFIKNLQGAELSKSTNALKSKEDDYKEDDFSSIGKLVSAFPNNGTLEPFEKRPIFLRFSPQYILLF